MNFNEETIAQIIHIQINDIIRFCGNILNNGSISIVDAEKVEKMFKILYNKDTESKTKEKIETIETIIL